MQTFDKYQVKDGVDLVAIVQSYGIQLRPMGSELVGLCPFHSEKTPSFYVSPSKQLFHCWGCEEGGDVYEFLMLKEGISFPEAVSRLGSEARIVPGIHTTAQPRRKSAERMPPRTEHLDMYAKAYELARDAILNDDGSDSDFVRQYLISRGFTLEDIRKLPIGAYLPKHRRYFEQTYPDELKRTSGLVSYGKGYNYQIIFPHYGHKGEIIGLAFRITKEGTDYQHQPLKKFKFTPHYNKDIPFNLYSSLGAVKAAGGDIIVVEGHFDVYALIGLGFDNAICLGGHTLNKAQLDLMHKAGARNLFVWMDNDGPGFSGLMDGVKTALQHGKINVYVIESEYNDVGEINRLEDRSRRIEIITAALKNNVFGSNWLGEKAAQFVWNKGRYEAIENDRGRQQSLDDAREFYAAIPDTLQRHAFLKHYCKTAKLRMSDLSELFEQKQAKGDKASGKLARGGKKAEAGDPKAVIKQFLTGIVTTANGNAKLDAVQRYINAFRQEVRKKRQFKGELQEIDATIREFIKNYRVDLMMDFVNDRLRKLNEGCHERH